jgi:diacylglycerol O-acyltransferase / wax synthase
MASYEPLSPMDANFLHWETPSLTMHIGNVCIFEGDRLFDESGRFRLEEVRRAIASRLHHAPRYRKKVLAVPGGIGHPVLVDDPHFDIANHVQLLALPSPGTEEQLKELFARLHEGMLDRSRPLWQIWFVEGLEDGRVAMVQKFHHSLVDGVTSVDVLTVVFDRTPDYEAVDSPPWKPVPPPGLLELTWTKTKERINTWSPAGGPFRMLRALAGKERRRELATALGSLTELGPLPRTSLNRPIGPHRRFDWIPTSIAEVKDVRRLVAGSTVNDVMLAIVGGGVRQLLASRGEDVDRLRLRVFVPVSMRGEGERDPAAAGNRISAFVAPLGVDEPDGLRRLRKIHEATQELKEKGQALGIHVLTDLAGFAPPTLLALAGRAFLHQRTIANLTVTNVPGPQRPVYLMGAKMLELRPMVLIGNQLTLNVAIESYLGCLSIGLSADADANPDLDVLKRGIESSLRELQALAGDLRGERPAGTARI